jgi:hypothetical protein
VRPAILLLFTLLVPCQLSLAAAVLGVCGFVLAWMKFHRDEDLDTV